ncbi:MAG: IS4 family transposase [bacterium]
MLSIRKADTLAVKLKEKLQSISIDQLAVKSGFVRRKPRKIRPLNFILGFFIMVLSGGSSLSTFATTIGLLSGCCISKQAVDKRINEPLIKFLELVLGASLSHSVRLKLESIYDNVFTLFNRVFVQDSTTIPLPSKLAEYFPGSRNYTQVQSATMKIQSIFDLATERFFHFGINSFTKNDQRASVDILPFIQAGDLVIRDLGYLIISVLRQIQSKGAYFLSRLKYGLVLHQVDGTTRIDLLKMLKKHGQLDIDVLLGVEEKLPVRLIAIPVPDDVAAERRRKYKANRDRRLNPSKEHLALLGWDIFITNVDYKILNTKQVADIYKLRWRIEIIFKSWKSHFCLANVPKANVFRVKSYVYALLIFITTFQTYVFARLYKDSLSKNSKQLSLIKLSKFFREQIWAIILFFQIPEKLEEQIYYHCTYESRQDRQNYAQKTRALS